MIIFDDSFFLIGIISSLVTIVALLSSPNEDECETAEEYDGIEYEIVDEIEPNVEDAVEVVLVYWFANFEIRHKGSFETIVWFLL